MKSACRNRIRCNDSPCSISQVQQIYDMNKETKVWNSKEVEYEIWKSRRCYTKYDFRPLFCNSGWIVTGLFVLFVAYIMILELHLIFWVDDTIYKTFRVTQRDVETHKSHYNEPQSFSQSFFNRRMPILSTSIKSKIEQLNLQYWNVILLCTLMSNFTSTNIMSCK